MRIHFLGTGAGVPSLKRGMPAVALEREGDLFLFDCGEGTQMALQRSDTKASRLTAILISHLHGDHVLGLPGLLMSLQMNGREAPLAVVGPPGLRDLVKTVFRLLQARVDYPLDFREIDEPGPVHRSSAYVISADRLEHGILCFGYAFHELDRPGRFHPERAQALGIPPGPLFGRLQRGESVELEDGSVVRPDQVLDPARPGRRIACVTDTRFCEGAVRLATGSHLLIHEATFSSDRQEEAYAKGHSTIKNAAQVAVLGGAKALVLTHISPRYDTVDPLIAEARGFFPNAWVAEDGMEIELDLPGEIVSLERGRKGNSAREKGKV